MIRRETCPKCSSTRKKSTEKCCVVFANGNQVCHHCGYDSVREGKPRIEYKRPSQSLPQGKTDEFRNLLKSRCITEEVAARNKISWNGREVLFPYMRGKEIVNIKYRGKDKSFRQEAGAMKIFYGLNDIIGEKDIYLVEGEWDKLACEVAGYENVASVPDGAPPVEAKTYTTKFRFIDDCEHLFAAAERVIIAVDSDLPGKKLEAELIRRFGPERCWLVKWPLDCKDANEVLIKYGMVMLMECLENPRQVPIDGVFTAGDYFDW
jgi:twinkle protein